MQGGKEDTFHAGDLTLALWGTERSEGSCTDKLLCKLEFKIINMSLWDIMGCFSLGADTVIDLF